MPTPRGLMSKIRQALQLQAESGNIASALILTTLAAWQSHCNLLTDAASPSISVARHPTGQAGPSHIP